MAEQNMQATEKRAARVYDFLARKESVRVETMHDALRLADAWRFECYRMEAMLALATAQWRSSETLRQIAEEELARLKALHP